MRQPIVNRINWSIEKNIPDVRALVRHRYPDFVYAPRDNFPLKEIPVFYFHKVVPERLEEQLDFLNRNGYRTLSADELWEVVIGSKPYPRDAVALTFDDGTVSLWSVAFPLLGKYGFHGINFIVPGFIGESGSKRPTLRDFWEGRVERSGIPFEETVTEPLCTWQEIRAMHESGTIEFQSHTLYHHKILVSPKLIDFINPVFDTYFFGNVHVPVYRKDGVDRFDRKMPMGTPVYRSRPRMSSERRYFDDEKVRESCAHFVAERGGEMFFRTKGWRKVLQAHFRSIGEEAGGESRYESETEREEAILSDLRESKRWIEEHIPDHEVRHLCYPWFEGSDLSVELSKRAGYVSNFWGPLPGRAGEASGGDPYRIARLDEGYLFRLPGKGRKPLHQILARKFQDNYRPFLQQLWR